VTGAHVNILLGVKPITPQSIIWWANHYTSKPHLFNCCT